MKEIIDWLINVEGRAYKLYDHLSSFYPQNDEMGKFLRRLSDEEKGHQELMIRAEGFLKDHDLSKFNAGLSESTKGRVNAFFDMCEKLNGTSNADRLRLLDQIVSIEYSEWNTLFTSVINLIKAIDPSFAYGVRSVHQHLQGIERFVSSQPGTEELIARIRNLPRIWKERILIVDDEEMITLALKSLLDDLAEEVDTASNGKEGLEMMSREHYGAIISDVKMPVMGGIEFYNEAMAKYPETKGRFIFMTGFGNGEHITFFEKNKIKFILKPMDINDLRAEISKILKG